MIKRIFVVVLFLFYLIPSLYSQQVSFEDSVSYETIVSLSAFVEPKQVPLNRPLVFTVCISWEGNLDQIEIGEIEEPILSNFDIIGTSSSNRVVGIPGGKKATKEIVYTLQPKTLGMGYLESVGLSYKDKSTEKSHQLKTQRISIEVISPVSERGQGGRWWIWVVIGCVVVGGGCSIFLFRKKLTATRTTEEEIERIVEEIYLEELKETVDLKEGDRRESFTTLSKLFRRYLSEKYGISTLEATTEELLRTLTEKELEENLIRKCDALFRKADVVKFSGQEATQSELEEAYTAVETVLESHLAQERENIRQVEEEKTKKKKKFKVI